MLDNSNQVLCQASYDYRTRNVPRYWMRDGGGISQKLKLDNIYQTYIIQKYTKYLDGILTLHYTIGLMIMTSI